MSEPKTECRKCRESIPQLIADKNCGCCTRCTTSPKFEDVVAGTELGMRFFLGVL